jgi:hypothetical protein
MKKQFLLFIITILTIFSSCSKFEDGPCISFRSEEKRFLGEWSLKYFTVDRVDSLQYWNNYFGNECIFNFTPWSGEIYNFYVDWGSNLGNYYHIFGHHFGINEVFLGPIGFVEDINSTAFPLYFMHYPNPRNLGVEWTITRLKYQDLWFEMDVNDKHYELHLERINS